VGTFSHRPKGLPWWAEIVAAALLSGAGVLYMTFAQNDRIDAQRLSVVETKQKLDADKVDHIQDRVDKIYDKLLEWEKR
jgi:hypothetical protein